VRDVEKCLRCGRELPSWPWQPTLPPRSESAAFGRARALVRRSSPRPVSLSTNRSINNLVGSSSTTSSAPSLSAPTSSSTPIIPPPTIKRRRGDDNDDNNNDVGNIHDANDDAAVPPRKVNRPRAPKRGVPAGNNPVIYIVIISTIIHMS
jgi:hypothetical protein